MLTLHPGVRVNAALYNGVVNVTIRPSRGGTSISYDLDSIDIASQRLIALPGATAAGSLSGTGNLLLSPTDIAETGDGELNAAGLTITSPFATSPIRLGTGHSTFKLDEGLLTIEQFTTTGGDLTLTAQGHHRTYARSERQRTRNPVHARAVPQRQPRTSPASSQCSPIPRARIPYHLTGTLSAPQIN